MVKKIFLLMVASAIAFFAVTINEAEASHWRFGHLTWKPNPAVSQSTADFTFIGAFRRNAYTGTAGDGYPAIGDVITESIGATGLNFGDGNFTPILQFKVISIDPAANWLLGVALEPSSLTKTTITHTYASQNDGGNPWLADIYSCCRTGTEVNNPNNNYRVLTYVDLSTGNSSPVSSLPAIVNLVQGPASSFFVPASDPDPNTDLTWRLATGGEATGFSFNQPGAGGFFLSIDPNTGLATWNTTMAAVGGLYSCQVIIEDHDATTGALRTQVAVDFLITIVNCSPTNNTPVFGGPSPTCGSVLPVYVGQFLNFTVEANDADAVDVVSLNTAGLPSGATMSTALPALGNPVSSGFSWNPTLADLGNHVVTFTSTDNCGAQSICSYTIAVTILSEPPASCPLSQGYWKNHEELWPASALPMMLGTTNAYNKTSLLALLNRSPRGDASIILAHQLIAAKLNVANGSPVPSNVQEAIDDADAAIGSASLPMNVRSNTTLGYAMTYLAGVLDDYNNGYYTQDCEVDGKLPSVQTNADGYEFAGNYPNPMNETTSINFSIPTESNVNIQIFNATGQLVKTLVDQSMSSGYHVVQWDGSDDNGFEINSGVYFVRLQSGSFIQSKSVIKVK